MENRARVREFLVGRPKRRPFAMRRVTAAKRTRARAGPPKDRFLVSPFIPVVAVNPTNQTLGAASGDPDRGACGPVPSAVGGYEPCWTGPG